MSEPKDFPMDMQIQLPIGDFLLIPFTRKEWESILISLGSDLEVFDEMHNIVDRIEKNLGIE